MDAGPKKISEALDALVHSTLWEGSQYKVALACNTACKEFRAGIKDIISSPQEQLFPMPWDPTVFASFQPDSEANRTRLHEALTDTISNVLEYVNRQAPDRALFSYWFDYLESIFSLLLLGMLRADKNSQLTITRDERWFTKNHPVHSTPDTLLLPSWPDFIKALHKLREAVPSEFTCCYRLVITPFHIPLTTLAAMMNYVAQSTTFPDRYGGKCRFQIEDKIKGKNLKEMEATKPSLVTYSTMDKGGWQEKAKIVRGLKNCMAPAHLVILKDASDRTTDRDVPGLIPLWPETALMMKFWRAFKFPDYPIQATHDALYPGMRVQDCGEERYCGRIAEDENPQEQYGATFYIDKEGKFQGSDARTGWMLPLYVG